MLNRIYRRRSHPIGRKKITSIALGALCSCLSWSPAAHALEGYTECCRERQTYTFDTVVDVAYGANGHYFYLDNVTGPVLFSNSIFGDPIPGTPKKGYYRPAEGGAVGKQYSWDSGQENTDFKHVQHSVGSGILTLTLSQENNDPYVRLKSTDVDGNTYNHVRLRVKNNTSGTAWKIYFKPAGGWEGGNSVNFNVPADNSWHTYVLKMNTDPDWKGTISSIRLDPQGSVSGTVKVDYVEIISTPGAASGSQAHGDLPNGMPETFAVGLFSDHGDRWMAESGVPWDLRYRYFVKGWIDNWGWTPEPGLWALNYFKECDAQGFMPCIQYYQLFNDGGNNEANTYKTIKNSTIMKSYFSDFKVLMERVKEFDKPVLIMLEADALGFLGIQTDYNPNAYAAVDDSGMAELSGLPNTVSGWGLAFLKIREAVGADNAILGLHISAWGSGKDIAYFSTDIPLQGEVDKVYAFLSEAGLNPNSTGGTYDLLVGDPCDRDADYYRLQFSEDRWWDMDDNASINSKSFNRYCEWLRLWNRKAGKRWVLWQIPLGNANHRNVPNQGGNREGYKDNRVEYFMSDGNQEHAKKFADAGVVGLLFGAGQQEQASYEKDYGTDGKPFMKSQASAFYANGVFKLDK